MEKVIRNADWVIAWDATAEQHVYRRQIDVAFRDGEIVHVGPDYRPQDPEAAEEIDGRGRMIMPGLINIHTHPTGEPMMRGLGEERRSRQFFMSSLYEYIQLVGRSYKTMTLDDAASGSHATHDHHDETARRASAEVAIWEMLSSGVTTFVDYSPMRPDWIEQIDTIGIRTCFAPSFRSGTWCTANGREVIYDWDEAAGWRAFDEAMAFLDRVADLKDDRFMAMIAPGQIDTCTADLIKTAHAQAEARDLPMTIHAAQSVVEFREMMSRHGMTPIAWLEHLGVLTKRMIVGHAIFLDQHSWIGWPDHKDLARLAASGSSVAHCPVQFSRGGITLEYFSRYVSAGINMAIGTDTYPHNMLDEMKTAAILAKVAARDVDGASAAQVLHAATVGGANVLQRPDLGRIGTGCKADLLVIDLNYPQMQPSRDPLRALLFSAQDRAIKDVYIDGQLKVRDGRPLGIDIDSAIRELSSGQQRALPGVPHRDWAKRSADEAFPLALPIQ